MLNVDMTHRTANGPPLYLIQLHKRRERRRRNTNVNAANADDCTSVTNTCGHKRETGGGNRKKENPFSFFHFRRRAKRSLQLILYSTPAPFSSLSLDGWSPPPSSANETRLPIEVIGHKLPLGQLLLRLAVRAHNKTRRKRSSDGGRKS